MAVGARASGCWVGANAASARVWSRSVNVIVEAMDVVRKLRRLQPAESVELIGSPHVFPAVPPVNSVAVIEGKSQKRRWFLPRGWLKIFATHDRRPSGMTVLLAEPAA